MTWFTVKGVVPGTCNNGGMVKVKMRGGLGGLFGGKDRTDTHRISEQTTKKWVVDGAR